MALQNRVAPDGSIHAVRPRGTFMGNRGVLHDAAQRLHPTRRWRTKAWIVCLTRFGGRRRPVMAPGLYTELFFLDEVTALAAGHRPCFECRRRDAIAFAEAFTVHARAGVRASARAMDETLHAQRLAGREARQRAVRWERVGEGVVVRHGDRMLTRFDGRALAWSFEGWRETEAPAPAARVAQLTPPATARAIACGYRPAWHETART